MAVTQSTGEGEGEGHVAVLPWPFTSHPFALFNLVGKVAALFPRVRFSFISTPGSNRAMLLSAQNSCLPNIKTYNVDDGMPNGDHEPLSLQVEAGFFVSILPQNIKRGIEEAVSDIGRGVTCLMTDAMLSSAVGKMAEEMNVPWVALWVPTPYAFSAHLQMDLIQQLYMEAKEAQGRQPAEHRTLEAIPGLSAIRIGDLPQEVVLRDKNYPDTPALHLFRKMPVWLPKASAVVMNSYEELNPALVTNSLKSKLQNLFYVGFLTIPVPLPSPKGQDTTGCLSWLHGIQKAANSVVYIGFGTVMLPPRVELVALAEALEATGVPFLWSLKDRFKPDLPEGFLERTRMQGKVVPWAPQIQVLAHRAVSAHVTHCGFNSIAESILCEVPMICRPVWADNHINARMVVEDWGIGVVPEGGIVTKTGMIKCLDLVFHPEEGRKMTEAVGSLKQVVVNAAGPHGIAAKDLKSFAHLVANQSIM